MDRGRGRRCEGGRRYRLRRPGFWAIAATGTGLRKGRLAAIAGSSSSKLKCDPESGHNDKIMHGDFSPSPGPPDSVWVIRSGIRIVVGSARVSGTLSFLSRCGVTGDECGMCRSRQSTRKWGRARCPGKHPLNKCGVFPEEG